MRLLRSLVIVVALFLCACGPGVRRSLDPAGSAPDGTGGLPALSELPQRGVELPRITSATHTFAAGDVMTSQNASFTGTTLSLARDPFSYAILGANVGGEAPLSLTLSGACSGLWVAVSDYSKGTWHWIGEDLGAPLTLNLGGGTWTSVGKTYFALVCPEGSEAALNVTLNLTGGVEGTWNFLVWFAGDNDLAEAAVTDLQELEAVGSSANINILAGFDIDPNQTSGGVTGLTYVRYIKVVQDSDLGAIIVDGDPANKSFDRAGFDSSDPTNIASFVSWAATYFPAQHTALVLWDHGDGWRVTSLGAPAPLGFRRPPADGPRQISGVLGDYVDGNGEMTPNSAIADALASHHFDLLLFDACNMGHLEALYEYRDLADWLVASEVLVPNDGYPYTAALNAWLAAFPLSAEDVGKAFVDANTAYYSGTGEYVVHAAVSSAELSILGGRLSELVDNVMLDPVAEKAPFTQAMDAAFEPDSGDGERDLLGFLTAYKELTANPQIEASLAAAITSAQNAIYAFGQFDQPGATGISVWLPSSMYFDQLMQNEYAPLAFDTATSWLNMLQAVVAPNPEVAWIEGDKVVVSWDSAQADCDLEITDPGGFIGSPYEPIELAGKIDFSQDSYDSGIPEEWGKLLPGGASGVYHIDVYYNECVGPPPASLTITAKLYGAGDVFKRDLATVIVDPVQDVYTAFPLATLIK